MQAFYGTRLSEHRALTPEGYLICYDTPIARIGTQLYRGDEVNSDKDVVEVHRIAEEIFKPSAVASFEGKAFTNNHPFKNLDVNDTLIYQKGDIHNVRPDKNREYLLADIIVKDKQTIDDIGNGKVELSAGYDCDIIEVDGRLIQVNIVGNHVALVNHGRAGSKVRVLDKNFEESKHPRAEDGKFTSGAGSTSTTGVSSEKLGDLISNYAQHNNSVIYEKLGKDLGVDPKELEATVSKELGKDPMTGEPIHLGVLLEEYNEGALKDITKAISSLIASKKSVSDYNSLYRRKEIKMKKNKDLFAKMLKSFVKDAEPDEIKEAIQACHDEEETPAEQQKEDDKFAELQKKIDIIEDRINGLMARKDEEPELTALDELEEEIMDEDVDKRKDIDEIGGILKGKVDEELWRTIIGKVEKIAYNNSEAGKHDDVDNDPKLIEALAEKAQSHDEDVDKEDIKKEIADAKKVIGGIKDKATRLKVADSFAKMIRGRVTNKNYKYIMDAALKNPSKTANNKVNYDEAFKKIKENHFRK